MDPFEITVWPSELLEEGQYSFDSSEEVREALEPRNLRGVVDDIDQIMEQNQQYKERMEALDSGRPGHYWGKDIVIEAAMPLASFLVTHLEYDGDPDWYQDDRKFQDFLKRNPGYSWLRR